MLSSRIPQIFILIAFLCTSAAQKCTNLDCCSATEEELSACRGLHSKCPGYYTDKGVDVTSCDECEPGLCRVGGICTCPERYLSMGYLWQRSCAVTHTQNWPLSAGKKDVDRRKCEKPPLKMPEFCRNMSCCEATEEQLQACRGFHKQCPGYYTDKGVDVTSCDECEPGLCRVGGICTCPERYLSTGYLWQRSCEKSHGAQWPLSKNKHDKSRNKCRRKLLPEDSSTPDASTSAAPNEPSLPEKPNHGNGSSTPSTKASNSVSVDDPAERSPRDGADLLNPKKNSEKENPIKPGLATGEIIGLVIAGISALATVAGVVVAARNKESIKEKFVEWRGQRVF